MMRKFNRKEHGLMPLGRISIQSDMTISQLVTLDALARKWGCETLAEAAIEILRDALEPQGFTTVTITSDVPIIKMEDK